MSQTLPDKILHQRNPDDRISYQVYEIVCKYIVHHLCIAQYKIPQHTREFYFEVILVQEPVSCEVTNVTNRYMDFILNLDEEFNVQRPVYLDSNRTFFGHKRDRGMGQ